MSIDEAIKHCEEIAEENDLASGTYKILAENNHNAYERSIAKTNSLRCAECASEHRQLAEWLRELKKYRAIFEKVGKILADNGYTIDDLDTIFGKVNGEVTADGLEENIE